MASPETEPDMHKLTSNPSVLKLSWPVMPEKQIGLIAAMHVD